MERKIHPRLCDVRSLVKLTIFIFIFHASPRARRVITISYKSLPHLTPIHFSNYPHSNLLGFA